jgi:hypothetical protein
MSCIFFLPDVDELELVPCVELVGACSEKPGLLDAFDPATDSLELDKETYTVHAVLAYRTRQFPLPIGGQREEIEWLVKFDDEVSPATRGLAWSRLNPGSWPPYRETVPQQLGGFLDTVDDHLGNLYKVEVARGWKNVEKECAVVAAVAMSSGVQQKMFHCMNLNIVHHVVFNVPVCAFLSLTVTDGPDAAPDCSDCLEPLQWSCAGPRKRGKEPEIRLRAARKFVNVRRLDCLCGVGWAIKKCETVGCKKCGDDRAAFTYVSSPPLLWFQPDEKRLQIRFCVGHAKTYEEAVQGCSIETLSKKKKKKRKNNGGEFTAVGADVIDDGDLAAMDETDMYIAIAPISVMSNK